MDGGATSGSEAQCRKSEHYGEVAERLNALAWKASRGDKPLGSSNLPLSELHAGIIAVVLIETFEFGRRKRPAEKKALRILALTFA
jgi:hypothetical protein